MAIRQSVKPSTTSASIASRNTVGAQRFGVIHRGCGCTGPGSAFGECESCQAERGAPLQRRGIGPMPAEVPPIVHNVLRSPGERLDVETRAFMEPRFGQDFSAVRVHADARAAAAAASIDARAFASGNSVVFGAGEYAPRAD